MKFDSTDLLIFNAFVDNPVLTSTDLAKIVFAPKDRQKLIAKNTLITYRIKKWLKYGLITFDTVNNIKQYRLNEENIHFGDSLLKINGIEVNMGDALVIDLKKEGYLVKFLNEE